MSDLKNLQENKKGATFNLIQYQTKLYKEMNEHITPGETNPKQFNMVIKSQKDHLDYLNEIKDIISPD